MGTAKNLGVWLVGALLPGMVLADEALEEITVTAERRTEKAQDVPLAITALSGADLEHRGVRQAGDITAGVPNLVMSSAYGEEAQPSFSLRGVTTNDFSQNQSSPIAMYVDEIYKSVGAVQALQVYDLDRVEVLRGPQGTLYGKNATGGAISFYSKNPSLTAYDGYATVGAGNFDAYNVRAAVGGPIVDGTLGWRAAVLYEKRDGWVDSIVPGVPNLNGVDALAARFSLLYKPTDSLTALLKVSLSRSRGTPYGAHAINNDPTVTGFDGNISWFDNGAKFAIDKDIRNDSASLKLDWQLNEHYTLTSVTGYDFGRWYEKSDDGGLPVYLDDPNTYSSSVNAFSQEIRLTSHNDGPLNWLGGLYYGRDVVHANVLFHFFDGFPGAFFAPSGELFGFDEYNNFDQTRESKAAFLNATFSVTPAITLRAGVRYTRDSLAIKNFYALEGGLVAQPTTLLSDSTPTLWTQTIPFIPSSYVDYATGLSPQGELNPEQSQSNSNVSFKAGVDWKPVDGVLAYFTFSQGYRGAAFNGQAFNSPVELTFTQPEKLNAYEIGAKTELWERRAQLNFAAFHYDYRDQQFLDTFALPNGGGTGFHTVNAPKSRVSGAELELRAKLTPDLEIRTNFGVLDTKYVELFLHGADRSGNQLIEAPKFSAGALADWRFATIAGNDLHWQIDGNYYSKQYYDALNTERTAQPGYALLNTRLSLTAGVNRQYEVAIWGKNLANREYLVYGLPQRNPSDGGLGFDYALVGEPRTFGIEGTVRF